MSGFVYLIRNKDLYKIGITQNLQQRMKALKPDEIVSTLETEDYEQLEKQLHKRYKNVRIPQTEYFRLNETQLKNCKEALEGGVILNNFFQSNNPFARFFNAIIKRFLTYLLTLFLIVVGFYILLFLVFQLTYSITDAFWLFKPIHWFLDWLLASPSPNS